MKENSKKSDAGKKANALAAFTKERQNFKALLLSNPNYFGNFPDLGLQPIMPQIIGNTHYEELGCVGYHPQQEYLEAVVYVNQPSGYGGDICSVGSPEFVRFYLSFDNGATWQDQGLTSFQAHDIPAGTTGSKRLEYAVSLKIDPARSFCFFGPKLIKVRAILSWNFPPPANSPNFNPTWGNRRDAEIQVEPLRIFWPKDLFEIEAVKFPLELKYMLSNVQQPLKVAPKPFKVPELAAMYQKTDVPVQRFAFKELASYVQGSKVIDFDEVAKLIPGIQINPDILDFFIPKTDGDISYEELMCIGLDPNNPNVLVGVVKVKKGNGYLGGVCSNGSREYVSFWGDFDGNGSYETHLGTGSVTAYDLGSKVPANGVFYAVRVPVDLSKWRQSCKNGPRVVPIRAILSWNVAPPANNPSFVPSYGNREHTLINISPFANAPAGKIAILGGIPTSMIDDSTGKTTNDAVFALNNSAAANCAFGGMVTVQGAPLTGHSYQIEVTPAGGGASTVVVTDLTLTRADGTTYTHSANPVTKRFSYVDFNNNINGLLGNWHSFGDDRWVVKLSTFNSAGVLVGTDEHLVQLDNTAPHTAIDITTGAGNCGKFKVGDVITGTFEASDLNFGSYGIWVESINPANVLVPNPKVDTSTTPGPDAWSLDTSDMRPCGYVVKIQVWDLVVMNSQSIGHHTPASVGFCLE